MTHKRKLIIDLTLQYLYIGAYLDLHIMDKIISIPITTDNESTIFLSIVQKVYQYFPHYKKITVLFKNQEFTAKLAIND